MCSDDIGEKTIQGAMSPCLTFEQCIAGQCVLIPEVYYGAGKHIDQISPKDFQNAFKLNFVTQPIYLIAICLVKESIGFFLLRIAITPFYRRAIISIMSLFVRAEATHHRCADNDSVFMGVYTVACFFVSGHRSSTAEI